MISECLMIECLRSFCWVKSRGFAHLAALGLVSMMLHCVIVKIVELVDPTGMHKTGCSGETSLVLHIPSSSWAGKRFNNNCCYCYYHTTVLVGIAPARDCHSTYACLQTQHSQYTHAGPHSADLQRQSVSLWYDNKGNDRILLYACLRTGSEALVTWRKRFGGRDNVQSIWPEQLLGSWKRKKLKRPRWSLPPAHCKPQSL